MLVHHVQHRDVRGNTAITLEQMHFLSCVLDGTTSIRNLHHACCFFSPPDELRSVIGAIKRNTDMLIHAACVAAA
eukprot:CAMPEP_0181250848 /NCGR_PEP_ID=MMETSP1096-20121128/46541_1 /TAXON_ID=156174 ORGANISM="Chrysochromulina ericina, Strain CCMP281" /NCGR_SAMPLE_ID=MMETSP1096 /ASSEMBLY_ACC=CAM_ASM_000453 /LENGTH=74 /DNA_ID=CAMNT_0023348349 /DNA_START=258 /DNA_END=478 /DNA_ORIENTATION=+